MRYEDEKRETRIMVKFLAWVLVMFVAFECGLQLGLREGREQERRIVAIEEPQVTGVPVVVQPVYIEGR